MTERDVIGMIDHTILKQNVKKTEIAKACEDALEYGFYSVCVYPVHIKTCKKILDDSGVKVATVVGFPHGETLSKSKAAEARQVIKEGADEIDMVMCISKAKEGKWNYVEKDIKGVVDAAEGAPVKVIIETCLLTDEEITEACKAAARAGAAFVKTSTGFVGEGATEKNVALMKEAVKNKCEVKAAGGIRTLEQAMAMARAGATRIGTSAGVAIAKELTGR